MGEYEISSCRSCGCAELKEIISLGKQYVTNFIDDEGKQGEKYELDLVLCDPTKGGCGLLQLKHNTPANLMWDEQYWYKSAISKTIKDDLKDIVDSSAKMINLGDGDFVIDIGANDGTLLSYHNPKLNLIGFEPCKNVAKEAQNKGFNIINNFFNAQNFKSEYGEKRVKLISAISMFYDLEDPNSFMKDIVSVLDKKGLFVIQQNYLISMLEKNAFDNICHEHREYYSLFSLKKLLDRYNLEIFDAVENSINGGSIRTYIKFKDNEDLGDEESFRRVKEIEDRELKLGIDNLNIYYDFASRINEIKIKLLDFLNKQKEDLKEIYIYGASTRGNVILQYFGLDTRLISAAVDKNPDKWGKKTIGSLIPIISPEEFRKRSPDYLLVMTWHFFDEIKEQESEWFNNGGIFLVPLPEFKIIESN
jgi:NDP-4-keto-2,6-dideoxyhexose 3-C-methyltransferase